METLLTRFDENEKDKCIKLLKKIFGKIIKKPNNIKSTLIKLKKD